MMSEIIPVILLEAYWKWNVKWKETLPLSSLFFFLPRTWACLWREKNEYKFNPSFLWCSCCWLAGWIFLASAAAVAVEEGNGTGTARIKWHELRASQKYPAQVLRLPFFHTAPKNPVYRYTKKKGKWFSREIPAWSWSSSSSSSTKKPSQVMMMRAQFWWGWNGT